MRLHFPSTSLLALLAATALAAAPALAGTVLPGFNANSLPANDDGSTGTVPIGFDINFFGTTYSNLYVNNNGNFTFTGPLSTFTPFGLVGTSTPIIAPFFADVDTRGPGSGLANYGPGTYNGHQAFGGTWSDVGYYGQHTDKLNTFQAILVDRSDTGAGNFDIVYNYNSIQWETGDASDGSGGLGGSSARAGYSNGSTNSFEIPGSGIPGSFLDSNLSTGLIHTSNIGVPGTWLFQARNGDIINPGAVPEPTGLALLGLAVTGLTLRLRRRT